MENADDIDRQISVKKNEWIKARTAELGGHGSAENTRMLSAELKALEARKGQQENKERTAEVPEREKSEVQDREKTNERKENLQMVRKMRMTMRR